LWTIAAENDLIGQGFDVGNHFSSHIIFRDVEGHPVNGVSLVAFEAHEHLHLGLLKDDFTTLGIE
jgi:hypothetical protein